MAISLVLLLGALAGLGLMARGAASPGDGALMQAIAGGDQESFWQLYRRHAPVVLGMLTRMLRDRAAAEDLLQETFLTLWTEAERYDCEATSVLPWLLVIARNRALDRLRSAAHRREVGSNGLAAVVDLAAARRALAPAPWRAVDGARAREAMATLSEPERRCLELAYFEGLTQTEISARLGQPLGTVKSWVRSGLAKLRTALMPAAAKSGGVRREGMS